MRKSVLGILAIVLLTSCVTSERPPTPSSNAYTIITGPPTATYIQIGRDLAQRIAAPAKLPLEVVPSEGGARQNVLALRDQPGVILALLQSDVYQAYRDEATNDRNLEALIRPLRLVLPLYDEEFHFIVRADAPMTYLHEIREKHIGVGFRGSGTALATVRLYQQMFGRDLPRAQAHFLEYKEALRQLLDKTLDVTVLVAGQPASLFAEMRPEAQQYIKMLKLDPNAIETKRVLELKQYIPSTIAATSYPTWLIENVPTLAVQALLVTSEEKAKAPPEQAFLERLADELCHRFTALQDTGHAKWRQVTLDLPALNGWTYYAPTEKILRACSRCTPAEVALGLCPRG